MAQDHIVIDDRPGPLTRILRRDMESRVGIKRDGINAGRNIDQFRTPDFGARCVVKKQIVGAMLGTVEKMLVCGET